MLEFSTFSSSSSELMQVAVKVLQQLEFRLWTKMNGYFPHLFRMATGIHGCTRERWFYRRFVPHVLRGPKKIGKIKTKNVLFLSNCTNDDKKTLVFLPKVCCPQS